MNRGAQVNSCDTIRARRSRGLPTFGTFIGVAQRLHARVTDVYNRYTINNFPMSRMRNGSISETENCQHQ